MVTTDKEFTQLLLRIIIVAAFKYYYFSSAMQWRLKYVYVVELIILLL